jgi:MFS family permease
VIRLSNLRRRQVDSAVTAPIYIHTVTEPRSIFSRELLPVSIAILATAALASFQALGMAAALPDITADLGNVSLLPWTITVYLLASSLATVVAGPFIDAIGVSRMFRLAVSVFAAAGFAIAFAPSMEVMVGLRALEGLGAGLVIATGTSAVSLAFPQHLVGRAYAANASIWGVMGVAGPAVAALILTFASWHWIFYINVPLGLGALLAGWKTLPGPYGQPAGRFDLKGTLLLGAVTVGTLIAVNAFDLWSLVWLGAAGIALWIYVGHAGRATTPVVRLEHIVPQPYRGLALSTGLILAAVIAVDTYTPLYVRAGLERPAGFTAWSVLPLTVGWTTGAILSSRMADRHSESWVVLVGYMFTIPSLAISWVLVVGQVSVFAAFAAFFGMGIGVGMATNAALTLMRDVTDTAKIGRVASAHLFARNQGFTLGSAIGGAVLLLVVTLQLGDPELVRDLIASPAGGGPAGAAAAVRAGFATAIAVGLVISIVGAFASTRLRRALAETRFTKRG